ncbi:MAG TPA: hypothetical protein VJ508_18240, partial [Saprospiraceae bacterium]|nr:hypothetical protein [Saprospiraceae bacterium]
MDPILLLDKIIHDPLHFTVEEKEYLIRQPDSFDLFGELRALIRRIFDINERTLLQQSDATTGMLGKLNKFSYNYRIKKYYKLIKDPNFDRKNNDHKVIVAEGDSWFNFPWFVTDIVDWLTCRNPHYAIYCIAYGGDWLANMIYDGKYVEELSVHKPDAFLLSGGGNDLVGSNRIAIMVDRKADFIKFANLQDIPEIPGEPMPGYTLTAEDKNQILAAQPFINKEFYSFLLVLELQYRKIIRSINRKYKDMMILTQGYDFAIPSYKCKFSFRYPMEYFLNKSMTGKWLIQPLRIKGIYDSYIQRSIIKTMIYELNMMLTQLA